MSSHFDTIHLKLSTHAYFALLFHSIRQNMKILKINFYDVITSVLYWYSIEYKYFGWKNENKRKIMGINKYSLVYINVNIQKVEGCEHYLLLSSAK